MKGYMEMYQTREKFRNMPRGTIWSGQRVASRFIAALTTQVSVLDYGCGTGSLRQFPPSNATIYGFDVDVTNRAAHFHSLVEIGSRTFDVVILSHVLEHLTVESFHEILQWLAPRTDHLVIMTPLVKNPFVDFWYDPTHIRPWGSEWLAAFLDHHGFEPTRIFHTNIADGRLHWYTPFRVLVNLVTGTPPQYELTMICKMKAPPTPTPVRTQTTQPTNEERVDR